MAVYTEVPRTTLQEFLGHYALGDLKSYSGISAGVENTNYSLVTTQGRYILTLFEQTRASDLPFCLELMAYLRDQGLPSARPQADRRGEVLHVLDTKPAVLVEQLPGSSVRVASRGHCRAVGAALARLHLLTQTYSAHRANERGLQWHHDAALRVGSSLSEVDRKLLTRALETQSRYAARRLPQGVIHADLFRDNVLFVDDAISGLIDFYYAHTGPLIYDLAVTVSDWCFHNDGRFEADKALALVHAYNKVRRVNASEIEAWLESLQAVALRFYLSRTFDKLFPRNGLITQIKDPERFRNLLWRCEYAAQDFTAIWNS